MTAALVLGVLLGLALTPDGRNWLRRPTLLLGDSAKASASVPVSGAAIAPAAIADPVGPTPVAITPLSTRLAQGGLRIGVIGDSMAEGLHAGLYRAFQDRADIKVARLSEVSTGLSRYDYVDVHAKTRRQLDEQSIDAAVILIGTNDGQAIQLGGEVHRFGTPGWRAIYAKRVDDLVALLRSRDVAVYWVGLPRMKRASFDERMTVINSVIEARMRALGVPYLPTTGLTSDASGAYQAYQPAGRDGRPRLMRANDGVHMSMAGYLRISQPAIERLRLDAGLDREGGAASGDAAPADE